VRASRLLEDYHGFDDILDSIIRCLVHQRRLRVDYRGLRGEGNVHEFDPYTLALYRGGLYLIGYSHLFQQIIWLAVERIARVERLDTTFTYPKKYSPQKYTEGMFGIIGGPPTRGGVVRALNHGMRPCFSSPVGVLDKSIS
jgi:hypothetical protein